MRIHRVLAAAALAALLAVPSEASAFCGFYIAGADSKLYNNATVVALMREGTRTVLSMQNDYQGPATDFAMVVPVPVVLQKENVKTLPRTIFDRLDRLASPRLVEYWEQDPCAPIRRYTMKSGGAPLTKSPRRDSGSKPAEPKVKIEAQFKVGEYDIVILSATEAVALETWIQDNGYKIPLGAAPHLAPYVSGGWKFFVAKVDPKKVTFNGKSAVLSPLRFHFDSPDFTLPIRLGLINSKGTQDLIVHILARDKRYEVANYDNVAIPTNLLVKNAVRKQFGAFYQGILDDTWSKHPGAVITEYSWSAMSCDPCPDTPLDASELATLGLDVIGPAVAGPPSTGRNRIALRSARGFVLTRLHARYSANSLGDDLIFREAPAINGGTGGAEPSSTVATPSGHNTFQGRYIIRHPWRGKIACKNPRRGMWGGPWKQRTKNEIIAASGQAFKKPKKVKAARLVRGKIPTLEVHKGAEMAFPHPGNQPPPTGGDDETGAPAEAAPDAGPEVASATPEETTPETADQPAPPPPLPPEQRGDRGCGCRSGDGLPLGSVAIGLAIALAIGRRRQRSR